MSGIFPRPGDGTLPPNPNDPGNPIRAYDPYHRPLDTAALYYGNGCDVRLRPEVMNSIISELAALADTGEVNYDPARQTNIELAVRYIVQRGLPKYAMAVRDPDRNTAPSYYTTELDPRATRYNDGMVLCLVPSHRNMHNVMLEVDGLGIREVLRNDGKQLKRRDWEQHVPLLVGFYNEKWYMLGLVRSQVALLGEGDLDVWVRTDGSDETGDGEFNTPESAFRTIQHAWDDVAGRYAPTAGFRINIRLGVAGTYEGAWLSTYGGTVRLWGDLAHPNLYRIKMKPVALGMGICLAFDAIARCEAKGVMCVLDRGYPPMAGFGIHVVNNTTCIVDSCSFINEMPNAAGAYMDARSRCTLYTMGPIRCSASHFDIGTIIGIAEASHYMNAEAGVDTTLYCNDMYIGHGVWCYAGSVCDFSNHLIYNSNTIGPRYGVGGMSIIMAKGQPLPGDSAGTEFDLGPGFIA